MADRHEVNFSCPDTDDPAIHHAPIASWDVGVATAMAALLEVPCYGFRFSTWNEKDELITSSKFYAFGVTANSAAELAASNDPKEKRQVFAAALDGMKRASVSPALTLCLRDTDEVLPALPEKPEKALKP